MSAPSGGKASGRRPGGKTARRAASAAHKPPAPALLTARDYPDLPVLSHYVRQGRCALFVGAGLSMGAGLPNWRQLLERLIAAAVPYALDPAGLDTLENLAARTERAHPDIINPLSQAEVRRLFNAVLGPERGRALIEGEPGSGGLQTEFSYREGLQRVRSDSTLARELTTLLEAGKFPELAGYCRDFMGRERFHDVVRRELQPSSEIPATHQSIVRTPYACVVTTNFDSLLEDAYARWGTGGVPKVPTGAELGQLGTLLFDDTFFILKAHGDLDDVASIIFTSEDYRRVIHSNPAFQAMLSGILMRNAVLFVGYSLSDVNFRLLLDSQLTVFNENVPPRYALMEGVGEVEREILWRTARLRVFSYERGRHDVVGRFLQTLAAGAAPAGGATPAVQCAPAAPARRFLGRPRPLASLELEIGASGERLVLGLTERVPGQAPRAFWSGGSEWPAWRSLRRSLHGLMYRNDVELAELTAIGAQLQRSLPDGLLQRLETVRPEVPIVLSLSPQTEAVPWEWLSVAGSPLCLRSPVVRRPTGVSDRARGFRMPGNPLRALVIADAGVGDGSDVAALPGAAREAHGVTELLRAHGAEVTLLERETAVDARLVAEVQKGDYDVIHFAGHAGFGHSEGRLYLWDGSVSSSGLGSILNHRPPSLLVLNSHFTAYVPGGLDADRRVAGDAAGPPGVDRPLPPPGGFMGVASRSGVGAFVGGTAGGMLDDSAAQFALELYGWLLAGANFAEALQGARKATTNARDPTGLYYAGSGYAEIVLTDPAVR